MPENARLHFCRNAYIIGKSEWFPLILRHSGNEAVKCRNARLALSQTPGDPYRIGISGRFDGASGQKVGKRWAAVLTEY